MASLLTENELMKLLSAHVAPTCENQRILGLEPTFQRKGPQCSDRVCALLLTCRDERQPHLQSRDDIRLA
jgi:hypothetical protein